MNRFLTALAALALCIFNTGCGTLVAPLYNESSDNVEVLKRSGNFTVNVGEFQVGKDKAYTDPVSIRGSSLMSPYDNSYASYLRIALRHELSLAGKLAPDAKTEITGTLLKNDLDISGISTGTAAIEARFVVKQGGQSRYDQVKSIKHEFPSAFAGHVAIPRGMKEYPIAVQKILNQLFTDKAFIDALK